MSQALVLSRPGPLTYARESLINPVALSVAAFATCIGVGYAGLAGGIVGLGSFVVTGSCASVLKPIRQAIDAVRKSRHKKKRIEGRREKLRPAGIVRLQELIDLTSLAEKIEGLDPTIDVDSLLDGFVTIALEWEACLDAIKALNNSGHMDGAMPYDSSDSRKDVILSRRRLRNELSSRCERLRDQMEEIQELMGLIAATAVAREISEEEGVPQRMRDLLEATREISDHLKK